MPIIQAHNDHTLVDHAGSNTALKYITDLSGKALLAFGWDFQFNIRKQTVQSLSLIGEGNHNI